MKLNQSSGNYEIAIPEGIHKAVIYSLIDLGTQTIQSQQYGEQEKRQLLVSFEIPTITKVFDKDKGEQAVALSKTYTLSMHEKSKLRELVEAGIAKKLDNNEADHFDSADLLGANVMLTIEHKNGYANIKSVSKIFDKEVLQPTNTTRHLELDNMDWDLFKTLHDKLKEKIMRSPEYTELLNKKENDDEDVF